MANRVCSFPSVELDGQLTILVLIHIIKKISRVDEQKIKVICPILIFRTNSFQVQNPLNERKATNTSVSEYCSDCSCLFCRWLALFSHIFQGLLDKKSEYDTDTLGTKQHRGPLLKQKLMRASDKWNPGLSLSHNKFNRFTNTQSDYFLVSECRVQLYIFRAGKLSCRFSDMCSKSNSKSLVENFSPKIINEAMQYLNASGIGSLLKISRLLGLWV